MVKLYVDDSSSSRLGRNYTLDDLEDNEEFQEVSERFLTSVGENSNDVFEYLRDSDFNLFSGMQRAVESGKFTDQQKQTTDTYVSVLTTQTWVVSSNIYP